jgi:type II secretory pathway predicted ATPase ExeA
MYRDFFRLDDYPFRLTADSRYFYMGEGHMQAKAYLKYILHIRDGVALVTGEAGVGKTVLLEEVLTQIDENIVVAHIKQNQFTTTEFLLAICLELGLRPGKINKATLLKEIQRFAMNQHCQNKTVVLIVDEAHNLNVGTLEWIRMLANLEKSGRKLLQIILVGQPSLNYILSSQRKDALSQMVRLSCQIEPLTMEELGEYIEHRLAVASNGVSPVTFSRDLLPTIMCYTGGIPRLVNILCDMMLIAACLRKTPQLDATCMHGALRKLGWPVYLKRISELPKAEISQKYIEQRPLPILIVRQCDEITGRYLVNRERMRIGRHSDQDIKLDDRKVSRHHAQIVNINGQYFIQDLNSTNGIYVRSEAVKWYALSNHDRIKIGDCIIEYELSTNKDIPELAYDETQIVAF